MSLFYQYIKQFPDKVWILDRSYISTRVYQSNEGIPLDMINDAIKNSGIYVDACVLLTCKPEVALARMNNRSTKTLGNFSDREIEFYEKIQEGYSINIEAAILTGEFYVHTVDTTKLNTSEVEEDVVVFIRELLHANTRTRDISSN
jgi:thymidylate kinase